MGESRTTALHRRRRERRRRRAYAGAGVVVLVTAAVLVASVSSAGSAATLYQPSAADVANPDRGFLHYTETHFRADGSGYSPLTEKTLRQWRTSENVTLAYRIYYLEKYVEKNAIDAADLRRITADLAAARAAGVKLVVRFAYTSTSDQDATPARVVAHVRALAPVLNAGADVIAALQAGFVGRWGEWYESAHFSSDKARPWNLTPADWAARRQVLDALLSAVAPQVLLQVRYPVIKRTLLAPDDPRGARVGIHDDCFLAGDDDHGTFAAPDDRDWLAEQTVTVPMGGETCEVNPPRSDWAGARAELAAYHWTYLNADYNPQVLDSWGAAGRAEAGRRLGYRLRLVSAGMPATVQARGAMQVSLSVANDGFAAPVRSRPVQLVLRGTKGTFVVPLPVDVRSLAAGRTADLTVTVRAPAQAGTYQLYLALPDPAPSLAARPEYAIRLANDGLWDAATGQNDLRRTLQIGSLPFGR